MDFITLLAEQKIKVAIRNGEFQDLPMLGKPLQFENDSMIPSAFRVGYKILRNAGVLPEEMRLRKEISEMCKELRVSSDQMIRRRLEIKISELETRYNVLMERHRLHCK